jgi:hypothetical protein
LKKYQRIKARGWREKEEVNPMHKARGKWRRPISGAYRLEV